MRFNKKEPRRGVLFQLKCRIETRHWIHPSIRLTGRKNAGQSSGEKAKPTGGPSMIRQRVDVLVIGLLAASLASSLRGGDDGFVPLFNGKDLAGWVNVNCAPETFSV